MSFNHPAHTYSMCRNSASVYVCVCANNEIEHNNNTAIPQQQTKRTTTIDCALPPQVRSYLSGHINSYSDSYRALCHRPLPKRLHRRMSSRMSQAFSPHSSFKGWARSPVARASTKSPWNFYCLF